MALVLADFEGYVESLQTKFSSGFATLQEKCDELECWLESVKEAALQGNLASVGLLHKTPGKKRGALGTINESASNESQLGAREEAVPPFKKPNSLNKKNNRSKIKRKTLSSNEDESSDVESDVSSKRRRTVDVKEEVIELHDSDAEANDGSGGSPQQASGTQRCTRVTRTTFVKETTETIVINKETRGTFVIDKETRGSRQPPTLQIPKPAPPRSRSPSPRDPLTLERKDAFKAPQVLKQRPCADEISPSTPPEVVEVVAPPQRMTRTKTRAMAKAAKREDSPKEVSKSPKDVSESPKEVSKSPVAEKHSENLSDRDSGSTVTSVGSVICRPGVSSFIKQKVGTPIGKMNYLAQIGTPNTSNVITNVQSFIHRPAPASVKKDRQDDYLQKITQKTNDASKKREEMIKAQTEEKIKKRQEKVLKVNAAREAMEKERAEKLRQQLILEEERLEAKRRKLAKQKAAEAAEAAKLAKRLQEEEQRRLAEEKRRELEEQKRQAEERKREEEERRRMEERRREEEERRRLEERKREEDKKRWAEKKKQLEEKRRLAKEQEEAEKRRIEQEERRNYEAEKAAALKAKAAAAAAKNVRETYVRPLDETYVKPSDETFVHPSSSSSYAMTPAKEDRKPIPAKTQDDYGIEDADCNDSSDEEANPKKEVPLWAQGKYRMPHLNSLYYIRPRQVARFFGSKKTTPDLSKIFRQIDKKMLIRKSSAVWRTPPVKFNESIM